MNERCVSFLALIHSSDLSCQMFTVNTEYSRICEHFKGF